MIWFGGTRTTYIRMPIWLPPLQPLNISRKRSDNIYRCPVQKGPTRASNSLPPASYSGGTKNFGAGINGNTRLGTVGFRGALSACCLV